MQRFKSAVFMVCLGAALAGCESQQGAWLEERQHRLDMELAEKMEIAQSLNERRRELEQLEQRLAELKAGLNRPSAEDLSRSLSGLGLETLAVHEVEGVLSVRLGGAGGASGLVKALQALAPWERALVLKRVSVESKAWSAELEVPAEPPPSVQKPPVARASASPMPPRNLFETLTQGAELSRKEDLLRQTQLRIAELDKVLGEVVKLSQRKVGIEAQVRALKDVPSGERLVGQRPVVEALFGGKAPRLATGVAEFQGGRLTLKELGAGDAAKRLASLAEVGRVLQSDADAVVLSTAAQP